MKLYIIVLVFCIIQFANADINDLISKCKSCEVLKSCFEEYKSSNSSKIPIYPPNKNNEDEVGKCLCSQENLATYKNCVECNFRVKNEKNAPTANSIDNTCKDLLNTPQNTNTNPAPTNPANPANPANPTNPTNPAFSNTDNGNDNKDAGNADDDDVPNAGDDIDPETPSKSSNSKNKANNKNDENKENNSNSKVVVFSIIGIVAAVGIIGLFVYKNKKKERPESMPFYGNAASPNNFSSLDLESKNTMSYVGSNEFNNISTIPTQNYQTNYDYTQNSQPYETNQYQSYDYENVTNAATADATYTANNEPTYDVRRESKNQFITPTPNDDLNPNASIFTCTYPYDPKLDDELELKLNDQIQIIEEYEDGWMKAINLTTKKEGMAPIVCVKSTLN